MVPGFFYAGALQRKNDGPCFAAGRQENRGSAKHRVDARCNLVNTPRQICFVEKGRIMIRVIYFSTATSELSRRGE